ncbi:MAG: glycosyltransferase family 39 protein [Acidobacteria bacterium]|nr:glycosyltransferase family 39 protein [Acidobacteriota bacterium]
MRIAPVAALVCFAAWCFLLKSDFAWDDADPEILNQAWRLAQGQNIYRGIDSPPFAFAAYPPVYFAAAALLMKFTGLSFLPARLLSFAATLFIGWALIRLSRRYNKSAWYGVWGTFFLFLVPAFLYNSARCHVQMMAVAFSIWSLVFFLRNRWQESLVISPLLAALAFYTKQTQIALPIAIALFLLLRNRRWFIPYCSVMAVSCLIPLLWLQKISDGYFFFDAVELAKLAYNPLLIPQVFMHHAGPILVFLCIALVSTWRRFRSGEWGVLDCYLGCLFVITTGSLGRAGAHGQYVLELVVATVLYLVVTLRLPELHGRTALVSIQILMLLVYTPLFVGLEEGLYNRAANRAAEKIYPLIKGTPGPILSQQGSFALFGRGEIYIQLFHFTALSRAGVWDQRHLLNDIERRKFPRVITEFAIEEQLSSADDEERFTPEMLRALQRNYQRMAAIYPYYLYRPADR